MVTAKYWTLFFMNTEPAQATQINKPPYPDLVPVMAGDGPAPQMQEARPRRLGHSRNSPGDK
jgi:hypothetical protein